MSRDVQPGTTSKPAGTIVTPVGEAALVNMVGLVDEHFEGFGKLQPDVKTIVINVTGMTRMTSFGVRQWLRGMDALPKTVSDVYLLGCPTFFVDQLNMVLNFGGTAQVLTVMAPYTCPSCGVESGEVIDVLADRAALAKGVVPAKECARCGGVLEFDETPESYFSFVAKYAASTIHPAAAQMLAQHKLYTTTIEIAVEKPPRIIKLVHGAVTYFRIIGSISSMFRARPFLVGAEGEVVIDLAEVDRFDPLGQREWRRLLKSLATQVPAITLVDVSESFLAVAADSIAVARNISVWSALVPYLCGDCGRTSQESYSLEGAAWPLQFGDQVCPRCGGTIRHRLPLEILAPLQRVTAATPAASAKLIGQRAEVLSRALTDANVAQAGEGANALLSADDTILGKYKIVRRLSSGGMAEVFLAKQVGIGGFEKPVALKRIQNQLLETRHLAIDMFLNEAKIAGRLMHPNIVQVLDVGEVNGALYLAMEYVRGKDLREINKRMRALRETTSLGDACFIVHEVAQALHHAYWSTDISGQRLSVVHRDVSPHNIILGFDGTVRLLDFGVAMSSVTEQANMIVGKWMYMSPEHTHTDQEVDHRSDLFSLGVIFYLLCSGQMPFTGNDPKEIVRKIRAGQYTPLEQAAPSVPAPVAQLVARMLAPKPADRPQSGREIATALADIMRTHNELNHSTTDISQFLARLFPSDIEGTNIIEIVRTNPSQAEIDSTRKLAVGSGTTQAQQNLDDSNSKSPSSFSNISHSTAIPSKLSPNELLDVSMALPRRTRDLATPGTPPRAPAISQRTSAANTRTILIVLATIVLAILAYWIIQPS